MQEVKKDIKSNKLENMLLAEKEVSNYSKYIANETISIEKYLSESNHGVINTIAGAVGGETHLLIAPTGSGKTYSIINILKQFNYKAIFILPNSANVEQSMVEYNIPGAYDTLSATEALEKGNVVVMTWDKVAGLSETDLSEYIIVIDEIHQTYTDTYRKKAIKGLYEISKKCKGRIDITATPNKLDFKIYDYITEYKQKIQTNYNVKVYNGIDTNSIINILNGANNGALLMNDTKTLKYISQMLNKESDIITSNTKDTSKLYDHIMFNGNMGDYKVLLNTTTIVAGVNINNPNITDVIIVGIKDIGTIKQYIARFRGLAAANVHIFNEYKEANNVYEIEWLVNENINKASILKDTYNTICKGNTEFSTLGLNISPINLDTNIYFNKDTNTYEVDDIYISSQIYSKYYNSRTLESFKVLLGEYFDNIEVIYNIELDEVIEADKKEYMKELKLSKEEAIEELEKHKDILVGYEEIKKNKVTRNLMEYQQLNGLSMYQVQKDYLKYNIHALITDNNLKSMINLYSKYVLENSFSRELAWIFANMGNKKRGSLFAKINTLIYRELKQEYPNIFTNDYSIEVRVYEWLINEFKEGTSYTSEHIEFLAEAMKITFGDNWALSARKLGDILSQIYVINKVKNKKLTLVDSIFYRNICPTKVKNNKVNFNTIKSKIEISDIKAEIGITETDLSIERSISKRKARILNNLNNTEQEILLEGVF